MGVVVVLARPQPLHHHPPSSPSTRAPSAATTRPAASLGTPAGVAAVVMVVAPLPLPPQACVGGREAGRPPGRPACKPGGAGSWAGARRRGGPRAGG